MNGDDYERAGYARAWEILHDGCEIPPSVEVFEQNLASARRKAPVTAVAVAESLASRYHRIPMPQGL